MLGAICRRPLVASCLTVYVRPITRTEDRSPTHDRAPRGEKGRRAGAVNQAADLWTKCTGSLRDQVSDSTWQLWLSGIEPVEYADGVFVLEVPNGLIRERVESRYLPMIEDTLANEVGSPVRGRLQLQEQPTPGTAGAGGAPAVEAGLRRGVRPARRLRPGARRRWGRRRVDQRQDRSRVARGATRHRNSPSRRSWPRRRTAWPMRRPRPSPKPQVVRTIRSSSTGTRAWARPTSSTPSATT